MSWRSHPLTSASLPMEADTRKCPSGLKPTHETGLEWVFIGNGKGVAPVLLMLQRSTLRSAEPATSHGCLGWNATQVIGLLDAVRGGKSSLPSLGSLKRT